MRCISAATCLSLTRDHLPTAMRLILSACSRLSPFGLQLQPRLVPLRGRLLRRDFHFRTDDSESTSGTSRALEAAFHGPDEYHPPIFDTVHHSFTPGEVFEFGDDAYRIERKLRHRLLSRVWLATHTNKRYVAHSTYSCAS